MSLLSLLNTTVTLSRAAVTSDALGGEVRSYAVVATFRGRVLEHRRSREIDLQSRRSNISEAQILCLADPGAELGDVVEDLATGRQYAVDNTIDEASAGECFSIYGHRLEPAS